MQLMMQMIAVSIHPHPPQNPFYSRLTAPVGTNTLPEPGAETRPEVGLRVCGRPSACTFSQRLGNRSTSPLRPLPRLLLGRNLPAPISITGLSLPLRFEVLFPASSGVPAGSSSLRSIYDCPDGAHDATTRHLPQFCQKV